MKRLNEITFVAGESEQWGDMSIQHAVANYVFKGVQDAIGIDPGKRWGLSVISGGILWVYWGKLPQMNAPDYHEYLCNWLTAWFSPDFKAKVCAIEGSAFGTIYGRELLEDIRLGFYSAFMELGRVVSYVPPLTARKQIFGSGKIKGNEVWLDINPNGADSIPLALYAGGYQYKED